MENEHKEDGQNVEAGTPPIIPAAGEREAELRECLKNAATSALGTALAAHFAGDTIDQDDIEEVAKVMSAALTPLLDRREGELATAHTHMDKLREHRNELDAACHELEGRLTEKGAEIARLITQRDEAASEYFDARQVQIPALVRAGDELRAQLAAAQIEIARLRPIADCNEFNERLSELTEDAHGKITALHAQLKAMKEELEVALDKAAEASHNGDVWEERAVEMREERDSAQTALREAEAARGEAERRIKRGFQLVQNLVEDPKHDGTYRLHLNHEGYCELANLLDLSRARRHAEGVES